MYLFIYLQEDGLAKGDMGALLEAFPGQALDFFGALRSATYDAQIRRWIVDSVGVGDAYNDDGALAEWASKLARKYANPPPPPPPALSPGRRSPRCWQGHVLAA